MSARSKAQQAIFGMALAVRRGELSREEASPSVLKIADGDMTDKDIKDFAETNHEGLPDKVDEHCMFFNFEEYAARIYLTMIGVEENVGLNPGMNVPGMGNVSLPGGPGSQNSFTSQEVGSGDMPFGSKKKKKKKKTMESFMNFNAFNESEERNDIMKGGKGDELNSDDVNKDELAVGIAVESEHTEDKQSAEEIALDHLEENPKYYSELVKSGLADEPEALKLAKELFGISGAAQ